MSEILGEEGWLTMRKMFLTHGGSKVIKTYG